MQITQDLQRAVHEVPPWGWGIIGIGTLYLVLHRARSATSAGTGGATAAVVTPGAGTISDPSAGMSAYIEGLNSGQQQQTELWAQELQNLQDSNAQLFQQLGNSQASQAAGGAGAPIPPVPGYDPTIVTGGPDGGYGMGNINPILGDPTQYAPVVQPYAPGLGPVDLGGVGAGLYVFGNPPSPPNVTGGNAPYGPTIPTLDPAPNRIWDGPSTTPSMGGLSLDPLQNYAGWQSVINGGPLRDVGVGSADPGSRRLSLEPLQGYGGVQSFLGGGNLQDVGAH